VGGGCLHGDALDVAAVDDKDDKLLGVGAGAGAGNSKDDGDNVNTQRAAPTPQPPNPPQQHLAILEIMAPKRPYLIASTHVPKAERHSILADTPAAHMHHTQCIMQQQLHARRLHHSPTNTVTHYSLHVEPDGRNRCHNLVQHQAIEDLNVLRSHEVA